MVPDQEVPVLLVLMPYADISRPSLGLSLLKSALASAGIGSSILYENLHFAEALGGELPDLPYIERLLGEWIFSRAAFPAWKGASAREMLRRGVIQKTHTQAEGVTEDLLVDVLEAMSEFAVSFVQECAERIAEREPEIVGCSSTFEQHCASLALLRRIKSLRPETFTVLGGANCESEMGWATLKEFEWVDCVFSGEADTAFPALCREVMERGNELRGESFPYGAMGRIHARTGCYDRGKLPLPRATVPRIDRSPIPDYTDYFQSLKASTLTPLLRPGLMMETSRGCWWGEKSHCTFCGLNGSGMEFRAKSPDRALREFEELAEATGINRFMVVDNIIDRKYFQSVLPALASRGAPYELFYETKANLRREEVRLLREAGVKWIQPGIEGFHDVLLKLMAKGNSAIINLQLLKYTREFGIHTTWLLLFGFPGENDKWHAEVATWLPQIFHLQPPRCIGRVLYDRFSLYHQNPEKYGIDLRPAPAYGGIYPISGEALNDIAYFFTDARLGDAPVIPPGVAALSREVVQWDALHRSESKPVLCVSENEGQLEFFDTRPCAAETRYRASRIESAVYQACEPATTLNGLIRQVGDSTITGQSIREALDHLTARRLILSIRNQYLGLAIPGRLPSICPPTDFPGGSTLQNSRLSAESLKDFTRRIRARPEPCRLSSPDLNPPASIASQ